MEMLCPLMTAVLPNVCYYAEVQLITVPYLPVLSLESYYALVQMMPVTCLMVLRIADNTAQLFHLTALQVPPQARSYAVAQLLCPVSPPAPCLY